MCWIKRFKDNTVCKAMVFFIIFLSLNFATAWAEVQLPGVSNPEYTIQEMPENLLAQSANYAGKRILFIEDEELLSNTDWDGLTALRRMLTSMGFEVEETFPDEITYSLVSNYDIVVFSTSWTNYLLGQREISDKEAQVLIDFVNNGNGLFLVGNHGLASFWSPGWTNSVNKVGYAL